MKNVTDKVDSAFNNYLRFSFCHGQEDSIAYFVSQENAKNYPNTIQIK